MKKRLLAFSLSLALLLTGCGGAAEADSTPAPTPEATPAPEAGPTPAAEATAAPPAVDTDTVDDAASDAVADAAADLAVRLLQRTLDGEQNVLLSPLSALTALGLTANGAAGQTLEEMTATLGLPPQTLNAGLGAYAAGLSGDSCLHSANGLWLRDDAALTLEPDFAAVAADVYHAAVERSAFDAAAVQAINDWVAAQTDGMVEEMVDELDAASMMLLVNALAFDARWETVYREDQIDAADFTTESGAVQPVEMMYGSEAMLLEDANATGFLKYYEGQRYAFAALLPNEGVTVADYAAGLDGTALRALIDGAQEVGVEVGLPKFSAAGRYDLSQTLADLGMPSAFANGAADFSALGSYDGTPLYIDRVLQQTAIDVDASGTRAGAATAVEIMLMSAPSPHVVQLTRPFVYLLWDCEADLPLFIGAQMSMA